MNSRLTNSRLKEIILEFGTGLSSESILKADMGELDGYANFPYDSGDFMRCVGVVGIFNIDMNIMKGRNPIWDEIVNQWETLVEIGLDRNYKELSRRLDIIIEIEDRNY
jgi:hypothetical protein